VSTIDVGPDMRPGDDSAPVQRRRRVAPWIVLAVFIVVGGLFIVLAGAKSEHGESSGSALLGLPAPEATGTLDDGSSFDLSRRKGSWVVLNFFDPECGPCVQEHPELVAFSTDTSAVTQGVELTTVVNSQVPEQVAGFFEDNGGSWPIVYDGDGSISDAFGVAQVPETWIVDPDGIVQYRAIGPVTDQQLLGALTALRARENQ